MKRSGPRKGSATLSFHLRTFNKHDRMRNLDRLGRSRIRRQNEHCSIFKRRLTVLNGPWALGSNGFKAVRSGTSSARPAAGTRPACYRKVAVRTKAHVPRERIGARAVATAYFGGQMLRSHGKCGFENRNFRLRTGVEKSKYEYALPAQRCWAAVLGWLCILVFGLFDSDRSRKVRMGI